MAAKPRPSQPPLPAMRRWRFKMPACIHEAQEQALISTMLLQVAEASQSNLTIDDLLSTMIRLTRLLMGVKKCAFLLWEDSLQSFQLKAWYGFEPESEAADQDTRLFSPHLPALASLIASRSLIYLSDPAMRSTCPNWIWTRESGTVLHAPAADPAAGDRRLPDRSANCSKS